MADLNPFLCLIPMWKGDKFLMTILPILPYYGSLFLCVLTQQPDGPRLLTITLITVDAPLLSTFAASHFTSELNEMKDIQQQMEQGDLVKSLLSLSFSSL